MHSREIGALVNVASVLVVEDDASIRDLLAAFLTDNGHSVRTAIHGAEALELLDGWRPGVILLDMRMPVMDGHVFRRHQLARPDWAGIPVVVTSATGAFLDAEQTYGAKAVITKPYDFGQLLALVEGWAGREA